MGPAEIPAVSVRSLKEPSGLITVVTIEESSFRSCLALVLVVLRSSRSAAISRRVLWDGTAREGWERGMGIVEVSGDGFL